MNRSVFPEFCQWDFHSDPESLDEREYAANNLATSICWCIAGRVPVKKETHIFNFQIIFKRFLVVILVQNYSGSVFSSLQNIDI